MSKRKHMPTQAEIRLPLIMHMMHYNGSCEEKACAELAWMFELHPSLLQEVNKDGKSKWNNRVRWVIRQLRQEGIVPRKTKGDWYIKPKHLATLQKYIKLTRPNMIF